MGSGHLDLPLEPQEGSTIDLVTSSHNRPDPADQMAQLIAAVDGLALAVTGIAKAIDGHGRRMTG